MSEPTEDEMPILLRFSRDVRVTGPPQGPAGPWAGVGRPFGGVLDPGVAAGEWPPAGLSHLALGGLLADALQPTPRSESHSTSGSMDDTTPSDRFETSAGTAEPTVREVIRQEGSTAAAASDTSPHADRTDGVRLSTREQPTDFGAPSERDGLPTSGGATDSSAESIDRTEQVTRQVHHNEAVTTDTSSRAEHSPSSSEEPNPPRPERQSREPVDRQQPLDRVASDVSVPRTVLRQAARGPPVPTTVGERTITRLVEGGAHSPDREGTTETAESHSSDSPQSAVERTMPTAPPDQSGPATRSAADGAESGGPPTPDAVRAETAVSESVAPSGGNSEQTAAHSAGTGRTFDGPSMTVLQDDPATGDPSNSDASRSRDGQTHRDSGASPRDATETGPDGSSNPTGADGRPSPQTRAAGLAPSSDEAVSTMIEGIEPGGERVVQRTIENVVRQPRLIDELYHEIERRRRIERERGGVR